MPVVVIGGPLEYVDGVALTHELAQPLARLVPVDEEHDARTEKLEVAIECDLVGALETPAAEDEAPALGKTGRLLRAGVVPCDGRPFEQAHEERRASLVNVGVGQRCDGAAHAYHQHVRVGGANVVLQHQRIAASHRRGAKPGMVELERCGGVQATHEGADARPVGFADGKGLRAVDGLARQRHLQGVELPVQIHDQQVEAVTAFALGMRHGVEEPGRQPIVIDTDECAQRLESACFAGARGRQFERRQHCLDALPDELQHVRRLRDVIAAVVLAAAAGDDLVERLVVDAARLALDMQIGARRLRMVGVLLRALQQCEAVLDAVVGVQCAPDALGQQQCAFSQRVDNPCLGDHVRRARRCHARRVVGDPR